MPIDKKKIAAFAKRPAMRAGGREPAKARRRSAASATATKRPTALDRALDRSITAPLLNLAARRAAAKAPSKRPAMPGPRRREPAKLTRRSPVADATLTHRKTMDRLLDRTVTSPLKLSIDQEAEVLRKLLRKNVGYGKRAATKADLAAARQHLHQHLLRVGRLVGSHLVESTRDTQVEAVRALAKFAHTLNPKAGAILDDPVVASKLVNKYRKALETGRRQSAAALTQNIRQAAKDELRKLDLSGMSVDGLTAKIREISAGQWWQAERTIRTETSTAVNTTQYGAFEELAKHKIKAMMRWTELVSDITGKPLDSRVANDSLVLHGQVAKFGGLFTMPPHPLAPSKMVGKTWQHPPNRPNDRSVLTLWMSGSDVPAWRWNGSKRVDLK